MPRSSSMMVTERDDVVDGAATRERDRGQSLARGVPAAGELVAGTYRVVRELGRGAVGTVVLAIDEQLDREVAVKFLVVAQPQRQELTAKLRREARAMARIRHPNVVQVYSFGEHQGVPYLVMEYVPGQPLAATDPQWRSLDSSVAVLEQICRGVAAIHDAGEVHNDLKPGNVLVGPGWRVLVADFGLAGHVDRHRAPSLRGTPAYMAPEVARGDEVEVELVPRRDVYALGLVAFEMLTGRRPFLAKGVDGLLMQQAYEPPPLFHTLRPDLPRGFDDLFARALAKQPRDRIASAERFRRELLALQSQVADDAPPLRIVVAEDDAGARQGIVELLHEEFPTARISAFADGESAQAAACESPPDLVITDLNMPGRGGVGLTMALRGDPRTRLVPIVVITAQGGAKDWELLRRLGADRFLVKPLALDSLVATIRALVGRRPETRPTPLLR